MSSSFRRSAEHQMPTAPSALKRVRCRRRSTKRSPNREANATRAERLRTPLLLHAPHCTYVYVLYPILTLFRITSHVLMFANIPIQCRAQETAIDLGLDLQPLRVTSHPPPEHQHTLTNTEPRVQEAFQPLSMTATPSERQPATLSPRSMTNFLETSKHNDYNH